VKDDPSDNIMRVSSCLMSRFYGCGIVGYASEHYFRNQRFSSWSLAVDVGFLKLTSDSFCGNKVF
jgi:hypothetical protein